MSKNYTVDDVAEKLGVSKKTILREIKRDRLRPSKVGRRYVISEKVLKVYLDNEEEDLEKNIADYIRSKKSEMISLLHKLVTMSSDTNELGQEARLANYIKDLLEDFGIRSVLYAEGGVVAVRASFGYADEGILLDCPLDTTPAGDIKKWTYPPFEGVIKAGKMYGRGTADCKAGIVAMIYAVIALKKFADEEKIRVELVFDGGEQSGEYSGMKLVLNKGLPVKAGIIGYAGTSNQIAIGCRGYHRFKITSHGHAVHTGARFKAGVNAITNMVALIADMEQIRFPKSKNKLFNFGSKLTFSEICGGRAINIVPDECEASLDIRTVPELKKRDVEKIIKKVIKSAKLRHKGLDIDCEYLLGQEGYVINEKESIVDSITSSIREVICKKPRLIVHGPSHIGTLLAKHKVPVVVWGPKGGNVHGYDEYVEIASVPKAAEVYARTISNYFKLNQ